METPGCYPESLFHRAVSTALRAKDELDWDAGWTLTLTVLVLLVSAGTALLPVLMHVYRTARDCADSSPFADLILVFGKKLRQQGPDEEYADRLRKAVQVMRSFPRAQAILIGGSAREGEISEAEAGRIYMTGRGVPDEARVGLEQKSRHTLENLRNARDRLADIGSRQPVLVSSRCHLARCGLIADSLGINHTICAAEERFLLSVANGRKLLVEAFLVLWFKTGRLWAKRTGNLRMLARIT